jgi:hypothetical protein
MLLKQLRLGWLPLREEAKNTSAEFSLCCIIPNRDERNGGKVLLLIPPGQ